MRLEDAALPVFGRHETFHLRYGWLKQAYDHALDDRDVFAREDAPVVLGVGKNMVRAMKFWALAAKVLDSGPSKKTWAAPTYLAHAVFDDRGLDPYLEKPQTVWLVHWMLLAPPCNLPVWWAIMNGSQAEVSSATDLAEEVASAVYAVDGWKPSKQSVKRDIDVFLHTYLSKGKEPTEDYLDCPLRTLGLLQQQDKDVRFAFGRKSGLSPLIVAYACLDFVSRAEIPGRTVSVNKLALEKGGPGRAFKISESDMAEMLSEAAGKCDAVAVSHANGVPSMTFKDEPRSAAIRVLGQAYGRNVSDLRVAEVARLPNPLPIQSVSRKAADLRFAEVVT